MGGDTPHFDMQDYLINWNAGPFGLVLRPELGSDMPPCVAQVLPEQSVAKLSGVRAGDMLISVNGKKTSKLGYEKVVKMLYKERLPVILHFRTPQGSAAAVARPDHLSGTELQPASRPRRGSTTPSMQRARPQQHPHPHPIQRPPPDFDSRSTASTVTRALPRGDSTQRERKQYTAVWENGSLGISFRPYSLRVNVPCVDFIGTRGLGRGMNRVCVNDVLIAINGEKTKTLGVERVLRWLLVIEKPVVLRFHSSSNRVAHGQSNSIESYQPEYEPARGTTASEAPRLQILYDLPPSVGQQQQSEGRRSQPTDARRLNNPSLNSYLASAHGRPEKDRVRAVPSKNEELTFDDAVRLVAKASGKPITEFLFAGVPVLTIKEGSPQAKMLFAYAKACLAKEKQPAGSALQRTRSYTTNSVVASSSSPDSAALAGDFTRDVAPQQQQQQQQRTRGNTLGRHGSSQFLSYKFTEESTTRTRLPSSEAPAPMLPSFRGPADLQSYEPQIVAVAPPPPPMDASPLPPKAEEPPRSPSHHGMPSSVPSPTPSDDFISLKDYVVQGDGQIADRNTISSVNSASTQVHSLDSEDDLLPVGSQAAIPPAASKQHGEDAVVPGSTTSEPTQSQIQMLQEAFAFDRRALNNTDISISFKTDEEKPALSNMISLSDLSTNNVAVKTESVAKKPAVVVVDPVVQKEIDQVTHMERSSLLHPLIAEMYGFLPDLHNIVKDKPVDTLLKKKDVLDEIQDILQSLQMEAQFERHSTIGIGTSPSMPHPLDNVAPEALSPSTHGKKCFQCGKTGELADLALEGGRRELYCQDCWEVFFFSENRLQEEETDSVASATPRSIGGGRDSADDAYKYSFHDSSVSRSDMIGPWRYLNGGDGASSIRDSTTTIGSSITDRTDEVWL